MSACARPPSSAIDRKNINQALTLGYSQLTGNAFVPRISNSSGSRRTPVYDPAKAKQLLAEAGHPNGFDAGDVLLRRRVLECRRGDRQQSARGRHPRKLRPLERAAFFKGYAEKKLKNMIMGGSGAFGNAATRLEAFVVKGGAYAYGSYPDIDELFQQQAVELDHEKRAAILDKMQQLVHDKVISAPIWQLAALNGVGPRVGESGFGLIGGFPYTAPYEDITLKGA